MQLNQPLLEKQPVSKLELARNADGFLKVFHSGKNIDDNDSLHETTNHNQNTENPQDQNQNKIPPAPDVIQHLKNTIIFKIALYDITQCVRLKEPTSIGARSFAVEDGYKCKVQAFICTTSEIVTKILQNFDQVFQILPQAVIDEINSVSAGSSARNSPRTNTITPVDRTKFCERMLRESCENLTVQSYYKVFLPELF